MKAITIYQPWASLIAVGAKRFETRSWKTDYRGMIAIHAAKKPFSNGSWLDRELHPFANALGLPDIYSFDALPLGAVIATAELVGIWEIGAGRDVCTGSKSADFKKNGQRYEISRLEECFGDWTPGWYAWELANVMPEDEPIPARGQQGLWEWNRWLRKV